MRRGMSRTAVRTAARLARGWRLPLAALLLALSGCAASPSAAPSAPTAGTQAAPKTLTIALPADPTALAGSMIQGLTVVPSRYFREFPNAYLTTYDPQNQPVPWLASQLPSLDDGTWVVNADGTMQVTWTLRPGITWQDGQPLTSADLAFSWAIDRDPAAAVAPESVARAITAVATPDPTTAVFTWSAVSQLGGLAGVRELDVLPRHVLASAARADLADNPYFTDPAVFVGSGPYRPVAWAHGSSLTLEAYAGYFLGRPKIDRVVFTIVSDPQAALASVLAGQIDVGYWTISYEGARILQQQWAQSGGGTVEMQANNARHLASQFRPEYASPPDLLDVRVRQALMYAMDRTELAETAAPGAAQVINSTAYPDSDLGRVVEARAIHYDYDPTQAAALLADAGWQKGDDGILTKDGARFQLEFRAGTGSAEASLIFPVLQQQYQHVGIDLDYLPSTVGDPASEALYPGLLFTSLPVNQTGFLTRFNSAQLATAQNDWAGGDRGGYANPAADALLNRVDRTLRHDEYLDAWADANRALVDDVAYLPLYNYPLVYIVRQGLVGPLPANPINPPSYFVHTWDVQ